MRALAVTAPKRILTGSDAAPHILAPSLPRQRHNRRKPAPQSYGSSPPPRRCPGCASKEPKTAEPPTGRPALFIGRQCDRLVSRHTDEETTHDCRNHKGTSIRTRDPTVHDRDARGGLEDLRARITATRWPDKETVADRSQGVQLATMQKLARYWLNDYDWRKCEARLNALPQFISRD